MTNFKNIVLSLIIIFSAQLIDTKTHPKTPKYEAIIFDMDGTIANTKPIWQKTLTIFLKRRGITITKKEEEALSKNNNGKTVPEIASDLIKKFNLKNITPNQVVQERTEIAKNNYDSSLKFIIGFKKFFNKTKKYHLKVAIASDSDTKFIDIVSKDLNLKKLFGKHIYSRENVNNKWKPNPDIYLYAAKQLNIEPNKCLAIDDSPSGIKAINRAGMFSIGINTGKNPKDVEEARLPINKYSEINLEKLLFD
ncbi:MAG: HAD-superfamily hydrolase, subfamily IA, variant 3 [candidate division TM6 bacterium GW2011_GWF2_32_72]|nr:MAG: HAD-superfamily hydrolase, subfamily IA, variant 3 [candidate division TM6 bacterium GW2011_GWF2_32_72]